MPDSPISLSKPLGTCPPKLPNGPPWLLPPASELSFSEMTLWLSSIRARRGLDPVRALLDPRKTCATCFSLRIRHLLSRFESCLLYRCASSRSISSARFISSPESRARLFSKATRAWLGDLVSSNSNAHSKLLCLNSKQVIAQSSSVSSSQIRPSTPRTRASSAGVCCTCVAS